MRWQAGAVLVAVAALALGPAAPADATIGDPVPATAGTPALLRLKIDSMTPRVVTAATKKVKVTGRITNTGDRRVADIRVKVQRGEPVERDSELRDLASLPTDSASSPFTDVAGSLDPGKSADVSVTVPARNAEQSLALNAPGVYPLLVNVNGRPDYGGQARLAAVSLPLPVLSVPGKAAKPKATPPGVTLLWPLLDTQPRRLPTTDGKALLTDDALAGSLSSGGRLFDLVNAVGTATSTNTTLLRSLCFAVDPDLLQTVSQMSHGYRVRASGGRVVPGRGASAARDWLARLAELTKGQCVISVPFADADLVALSRSGAVDLAQLAMSSSSIVSDLLAPVQPVKEVFWPAGGSFDQRTLVDLASVAPATVLADPGHLRTHHGRAPYTVTGMHATHPVRVLPVDRLLSDTLRASSLQDGLAALAFRTLFDRGAKGDVLITPPRRWTAPASELAHYLAVAGQLFGSGDAIPRPLDQTLTAASAGTVSGLTYAPQDAVREIPAAAGANAVRINKVKRDLLDAMDDDNTSNVDPNALLSPMQYGLLRGMSTAWRGRTSQAVQSVAEVGNELNSLRAKVIVNNPGRPLTLASGDSPIPVKIENGLPVAIVVRINLAPTSGLRPEALPTFPVPPLSNVSKWIPAEVVRSGRFSIDATLSTPGGTTLGGTTRLELTSTSYGFITVAVTGTAGGVLVLLVAIRLTRRARGARARRNEAAGER